MLDRQIHIKYTHAVEYKHFNRRSVSVVNGLLTKALFVFMDEDGYVYMPDVVEYCKFVSRYEYDCTHYRRCMPHDTQFLKFLDEGKKRAQTKKEIPHPIWLC